MTSSSLNATSERNDFRRTFVCRKFFYGACTARMNESCSILERREVSYVIQSMKRWDVAPFDEDVAKRLAKEANVPQLVANLLTARGITDVETVEALLQADPSSMHDPFLMHSMKEAVALIQEAIDVQEPILVYGDYDADGVTSTSVLKTALERAGALVDYAIPNRFIHGYGPNADLFEEKIGEGFGLIITVDNGIAGFEAIDRAKELGANVIVTDHHDFGEQMPNADYVIHPRHPEGNYPFGELAGVGVAFKLATAILGEPPMDLLQFVGIGTITDLVPLVDENRYFAKEGLRRLRQSEKPGIIALAEVCEVDRRAIVEDTIGFSFGPRLNAPGRLGDASVGVELLTADDLNTASHYASELERLNEERKELVNRATEEAKAQVEGRETIPDVLVVAQEGWNAGIVGIVASRLVETYYRPTIVLSIDRERGLATGSARSIDGFHLFKALQTCAPLLEKFGGHEMAAGLTVAVDQLETLEVRLSELARAQLTEEQWTPKVLIDVPVAIEDVTVDALESLDDIRPFGVGFEKPLYYVQDALVETVRKIGNAKNHLKFEANDHGATLDIIAFFKGDLADEMAPGSHFSLVGDLQVNEWNGNKKPQMILEDIRCDEWQLFDIRGMKDVSRWLSMLPEEKVVLAFHQETIDAFRSYFDTPIERVSEWTPSTGGSLVLLDTPTDRESLSDVLRASRPERIYAHFASPHNAYFEAMPTRDMFATLYKQLRQVNAFDYRAMAPALLRRNKWKEQTLVFMLKVFMDLDFVQYENGTFTIHPEPKKQALTEAPTYRAFEAQRQIEERLVYATYRELKQLLDEWMAE